MSCEFEQSHSSYFQSRKGKCELSEALKRAEGNIQNALLQREDFY